MYNLKLREYIQETEDILSGINFTRYINLILNLLFGIFLATETLLTPPIRLMSNIFAMDCDFINEKPQQSSFGLWSWYVSNLKDGTFEQIVDNEERLNEIKNQNISSGVNIIISVPENLVCSDIIDILQEKFEKYIPNTIVNDLQEITTTNEHLYLIEDPYNKFTYQFRIDSIKNDLLPLIKSSQLQLNTQQPSPPLSDRSEEIHYYPNEVSENILNEIKSNDMIRIVEDSNSSEEDTEDEDSGAIILNFTRKCRNASRSNIDKEDFLSPVDSEVISISSFENNVIMDSELSRIEQYSSLRRVMANNNSTILDRILSSKDLDLKLVGALCRDEAELGSFSTAIRQGLGEDWILYDNAFHLNNLECCSMEEVLYGDRAVTTLIFTLNLILN